jgi:putative colanic acid biosynthesis acetyltransferase WcaF
MWRIAWTLSCRFTPAPLHSWRSSVMRVFGARIGRNCAVYPDVNIWAPWKVVLGDNVTIGPGAELYSVGMITVDDFGIISQSSLLCTATHDPNAPDFCLQISPIRVGRHSWIAAGAFIGPGVNLGEGAVVGARAVVTRNVASWTVVAGNPAREIAQRSRAARNHLRFGRVDKTT